MKIEKLTPAQEKRLPEFCQEWWRWGTNTERADRARAEAAILAMRAEIGIVKRPVFVWCESPATSLMAMTVIKSPQWQQFVKKDLGASLGASLGDSLWASLWDSLWDSLGASLRASLWDSLWASLRASLRASLGDSLRASLGDSLGASLGDSLWEILNTIGYHWWGQHESYWIAFYLFCRDVVGVEYDQKRSRQLDMWRDIAQSCCWWWCFENYVIISERPTVVKTDERPVLHSADGPALAFADGWQVHAWHGIRVDKRVIESPETITVAEIEKEKNAEIRRVLATRYGLDRYLKDSGSRLLDESGEGLHRRRLWRKEQKDGSEPLVMVEVVNQTAEPDGTHKIYFLPVHPELRPLYTDTDFGQPQAMTAHNAVASTFGLRGEDYHPESET